MKLHWLQHVPFEGLGFIETWAKEHDADVSCTRLYTGDKLPLLHDVDWLIIMGGPMNIFDTDQHPWLIREKKFIKQAIDQGKTVIGICLGAQLIADVLGAKVYPGPQKEIGWFPIKRAKGAPELIPAELTVFHWHGDTFETPAEAIPLATSAPGINQGFVYRNRTIGLQFHMETNLASMNALIQNCGHELVEGPFIQSKDQLIDGIDHIKKVNQSMEQLLNALL